MNDTVLRAVHELEADFPSHRVEAHPDGEGGAIVRVHDLSVGDTYEPSRVWVTFRIVYTYPTADIYPHYFPESFQRRDGRPLGEAFSTTVVELGPFKGSMTMASRKSNRWNAARDTAALKLHMVLEWVRNRP